MAQIYVNTADKKVAQAGKFKVNAKAGVTVSVKKLGGWGPSFLLGQNLGSWPEKTKETKKSGR